MQNELRDALEAIEKADAEVTRAHTAQWEGKQPAWRITIPADPKRDTDLILGAALTKAKAAILALLSPGDAPALRQAEQELLSMADEDMGSNLREAFTAWAKSFLGEGSGSPKGSPGGAA